MNIAICDDEKGACLAIEDLVRREDPDAAISVYTEPDRLLESGEVFDLVFLDIQFDNPADTLTGIDIAKKLRAGSAQPEIIFISAVKDYVFDAFDVEAFHYLIKPVDVTQFNKVYTRVKEKVNIKKQNHLYDTDLPSITVKLGRNQFVIKSTDVIYVENQLKKLLIHTVGKLIETYGAMKEIETQVGDGFFRCHRGYLINLGHIRSYTKDEILMDNGEKVYIAKERYVDFISAYMDFLREM